MGIRHPAWSQGPSLGAEPLLQHLLAELGALAAVSLRPGEELGQLGVALPLRVLDIGLQPQRVVQALLSEPDQVVVLVGGSGDLAGLAPSQVLSFLLLPVLVTPCPRAPGRAWGALSLCPP